MLDATRTTVLDCAGLHPDPAGVLRYLGYPRDAAPDARVGARIRELLLSCRGLTRPRAAYAVYRVIAADPQSLTLETGATFAGSIGKYLRAATRAAVFVATAGPETGALAARAAASRDSLGAMVFHAVGSWLAEAAVERALSNLRGRLGPDEELTLRYSPGYCGMALADQRRIFDLVDAAPAGVELLPTLIMKPVKSVSGLIGVGPAAAVAAYRNPCDVCPLLECAMRRTD